MGVKIEVLKALHTSERPGQIIEVEETRARKLVKLGKARYVKRTYRRKAKTRETMVEDTETRAPEPIKESWIDQSS